MDIALSLQIVPIVDMAAFLDSMQILIDANLLNCSILFNFPLAIVQKFGKIVIKFHISKGLSTILSRPRPEDENLLIL